MTTAFGWEWIFFINVLIGLVVAIGAVRLVPVEQSLPSTGLTLDLLGAVTLLAGLMTLVYAVVGTAQHGWASGRTLLLLGVAAALLAAFLGLERRGAKPLVPPATWRVRSLVSSAGVMLGTTGLLVGAFYLNTLYLQEVLRYSALKTGLCFLPLALVILAAAHLASHLLSHAGSRVVAVVGLTLTGAGALLLALAPDRASYLTDMLPGFLLLGAGVGLVFVAVTVTAMADVRHEEAGLASGIMTTAHELGAALGVAILAAVATSNGNPVSGYGDGFRRGGNRRAARRCGRLRAADASASPGDARFDALAATFERGFISRSGALPVRSRRGDGVPLVVLLSEQGKAARVGSQFVRAVGAGVTRSLSDRGRIDERCMRR